MITNHYSELVLLVRFNECANRHFGSIFEKIINDERRWYFTNFFCQES